MKACVLVATLLCGLLCSPFYAVGLARAQEPPRPPAKIKTMKARGAAPLRSAPVHPPQSRREPAATLPHAAIPEQFSPPQEAYASFPEAAGAGGAPADKPSACQERLAKIAEFKSLPLLVGAGECGAVDAVILEKVVLPDQAKVAVTPPATLRCTMAEAIAAWLREDVGPAALKLGAPLRGLDNFDSYECRGRNRVRGATLSEHGRANALDVRAFVLANGANIELTDVNVAKEWRESMRASACARFSTVLGPGSDGYHEAHIHVDLAERRGGYKMCQWDVREPAPVAQQTASPPPAASAWPEPVPLPRPRPAAANVNGTARPRLSRTPAP